MTEQEKVDEAFRKWAGRRYHYQADQSIAKEAFAAGRAQGRAEGNVPWSDEPYPNQMFGMNGAYVHSPLCQGNGRAAVRRANALSVITQAAKSGWKPELDQYLGTEDSYIVDALTAVRALTTKDAKRITEAGEGNDG